MKTHEFRATVAQHHCSRSRTLMEPYSQGRVTVTFYFDPDRGSTWVWLLSHREDGGTMPVLNGAYVLENDWLLALFTDNARTVWESLTAAGWREIAQGSI